MADVDGLLAGASMEAKALDDLRAAGVNVARPDLKPFVDAGKRTYVESEERLGKDLVARVTGAIGK